MRQCLRGLECRGGARFVPPTPFLYFFKNSQSQGATRQQMILLRQAGAQAMGLTHEGGMAMKKIGITKFAGRHFAPDFVGTRVVGLTSEQLVELANQVMEAGATLQEGYAPFCKHLFVVNPSGTRAGVAEITPENAGLLRSDYVARRESELPVLVRWFERLEAPIAAYLDLVLYSHEQLVEEADEEVKKDPAAFRDVPDAEWGIVSINAEVQPTESPMPPATMVRNALGKSEGGSGVPLNREAYTRAVEFWRTHAVVK